MARTKLIAVWVLIFVVDVNIGPADDYPQFRGLNGFGVVKESSIPLSWSPTENVAWKVEIPGAGWSQPILIGDLLYVTTAVAEKEIKPKNFASGVKMPQSMGLGGLSKPPNTTIQWQVHCLNAATGKSLWVATLVEDKPKHPIHPSNTYATETPVADSDGVYCFFGATGTVAGLNHQGRLLWQQELGSFPTNNGFGTGSSMAIYEGKVYVQHFTSRSGILACFDTKTGDIVWRVDREKKESSWSSPIIWKNDVRVELVCSGADKICSYDLDTGHELWQLHNVKTATACSVAADQKRIYFGGSDPFSTGPLFAMRAGASGDISPKSSNGKFESCDWLETKGGPGMPSPVSTGWNVYVVNNNILKCYDAETGIRLYQNRLPSLTMVAASPIIVGEKLLVIDEQGNAALVKIGPAFEIIGQGKLDDTFWSTPAVGNNSLYFRGVDALYCIRE